MTDGDTPDVTDVGTTYIEPAGDDAENVEVPEGADPAASTGTEGEGDADPAEDPADASPDGKPTALVHRQPTPAPAAAAPAAAASVVADVEDETPKERALRQRLAETTEALRKQQTAGMLPKPTSEQLAGKLDLTDDDKKVLGKYKPEDLAALREVVPILAKEQGYVKSEQLGATTYAERSQEQLDSFLEKHPEYSPANDPKGVLWQAFRSEFGLYKQPANPKDYARIFDRVHQSVFGIKSSGTLPNNTAAERKINVASHGGASAPAPTRSRPVSKNPDMRFDMLKGFKPEELEELQGKAGA